MAYIVTDACIDEKRGDCLAVCPVDAIHEIERMVVIDPRSCFDCGACAAECPLDAIFMERYLPPNRSDFKQINAAYLTAPETIDAMVDDYWRRRPHTAERATSNTERSDDE